MLMKWYTQNCAVSFGKTRSSTSTFWYQYVVSINYVSNKDISTNVQIVLVLKNVVSTLESGSAALAMEGHHRYRCMHW